MTDAIRFTAQVFKVQTLIDGGVRLTLDLIPPTSDAAIMDLMKCRKPGVIVDCAAVAVEPEKETVDDRGKHKKIHI